MVMPSEPERVPPVVRDPRIPRFPVVIAEPTFEQVKENVRTSDYTQAAVVSATCFPAGYFLGASPDPNYGCGNDDGNGTEPRFMIQIARYIDRHLAVRGMWFTGIIGTLGCVMLAFQNTELRLKGFGRNDVEVARHGIQTPPPPQDNTTHN
jgi:hypothetical protein